MPYWGIDTEGSTSGSQDVHSIQVCSSEGEHTGKVFWNPQDFKEWLRTKTNKPKFFFAFTLTFEYGSLASWELLNVQNEKGLYPWQSWAEAPINLFYLGLKKNRIPVYDVRSLFFQLRNGNDYLTNLEKLGNYLSECYGADIHKLPAPLGAEFGKRTPTEAEKPYFEKYGIRDAYICSKAAQWIHENVIEKWLNNAVSITDIYSWGTVAKHYFLLPKIGKAKYYPERKVVFPNFWHKKIFEGTYAGRSEAFYTGNLGHCFYNDVSSLYPTAIIQTQCLLIRDVTEFPFCTDRMHGKITWQKFFEVTGYPYGWILGDFCTQDDLWGLPVKVGETNWYLTGTLKNQLYNTLDLEASNANILDIQKVLIPVFSTEAEFVNPMRKYEDLTEIKLNHKYESKIEEYCIKNTINSLSGTLGTSHPKPSDISNFPAYNTMMGQSHLYMSQLFHRYHTPQHPIFYMDTDSFFHFEAVDAKIRDCIAYPKLPFQVLDTVPLKVAVKGEGNAVIFRGKMYYLNEDTLAFSAWKPHPTTFKQIIHDKPLEVNVTRQVSRKWKTRDKNVTDFKIGRWFIMREHWDLEKLKQTFRADGKRNRSTYDSYQLFLDGKSAQSRAWTAHEAVEQLSKETWLTIRY